MASPDWRFSRRGFLAGTAAAIAAGALRPIAARADAPAPAPGKKLGFAVVGIGTLSKTEILPAIPKCQNCRLTAIVTGHPDQNRDLATRGGVDPKNIYTYDNFDDIKNNPDIDVVYIVLPNSMHAEYTIRGFKAGKHVLCEKPMATSVADCQAMIDACKAAGKQLMIAYRQQYEPLTKKCIQIARNPQQMGQIMEISGESGFPVNQRSTPDNYWRVNKQMAGGGSLMDMGIYALNAARYLSGQEPTSVSAMSYTPPNSTVFSQVEETMTLNLEFPSGMMAQILTSYGFNCNRVRVNGTRGILDLDPLQHYTGNRAVYSQGRMQPQEITYTWVDHFANEMDEFAQAINTNTPIMTPGEEGLRDIKIMMAAFDSAKSGQTIKLT